MKERVALILRIVVDQQLDLDTVTIDKNNRYQVLYYECAKERIRELNGYLRNLLRNM